MKRSDGQTEGGAGWATESHPLLEACVALDRALDAAHGALAAGSDPAWLPAADQGVLLERLARAEQRLTALTIRTLAATAGADGVTSLDGSRTPADWVAQRLHARPGRLAAGAKLGAALADRPLLTAALGAGDVTVEHARAVVDVIADLPTNDLDANALAEAERVLIDHCAEFTPPQVRRLGRHLLEVLAPDVADDLEARRLADEEREARRRTTLRLTRTGRGTRRLTGEIPELHATILERALRAIANPRRADAGEDISDAEAAATDGRRLSDSRRLGEAFCVLIEHLPTDGMPTHGGTPVTVTVTIEEERLREETAAAGIGLLDTGTDLSPGELRRLACQHQILPAVLDGASRVLDLGRDQRLFNRSQRTAMAIMHPECQARGCTIPAAWCEAHHRKRRWVDGGGTDLDEGALLCVHHHHRAHDPAYETRWRDDDTATFHRRC